MFVWVLVADDFYPLASDVFTSNTNCLTHIFDSIIYTSHYGSNLHTSHYKTISVVSCKLDVIRKTTHVQAKDQAILKPCQWDAKISFFFGTYMYIIYTLNLEHRGQNKKQCMNMEHRLWYNTLVVSETHLTHWGRGHMATIQHTTSKLKYFSI